MANGGATSPKNHVLLVEGRDEKYVVRRICDSDKLISRFSITNKRGIDKLLPAIPLEIQVEGRTTVGIVVDANNDLQSRWDAVAGRLREANIEPPVGPATHGTIIDSRPRIGVWLMPDNKSPGELEDFIADMIPSGDPVWPMSEDYIEGIPAKDRKFKKGKILRAKVHAWLATREDPRPMGLAIKAGDLDTGAENCERFVGWLRKLFEDEA